MSASDPPPSSSNDGHLLSKSGSVASRYPGNASKTSIHALPFELLAEIFAILHENATTKRPLPSLAPYIATVSHVCQRWRDIAISSQTLWSTISCLSREWTLLSLARCHSKPLDLQTTLRYPQALKDNLAIAQPHFNRARSLSIIIEDSLSDFFSSSPDQAIARSLLHKSFPTHVKRIDVVNAAGRRQGAVALDSVIGRETYSGLGAISLTWVDLAIASPLRIFSPNIRMLRLTNSHIWRSVDEMIKVLRAMPMLVILDYYVDKSGRAQALAKFDTTRSTRHNRRCVRLDHLARLTIGRDVPFMHAMTFFSYISCKTRTHLCLLSTLQDDEIALANGERLHDAITIGARALLHHFFPALDKLNFYAGVHIDKDVLNMYNPFAHDGPTSEELSLPSQLFFPQPFEPRDSVNRAIYNRVIDMYDTVKLLIHSASTLLLGERFYDISLSFVGRFNNVRVLYLTAPHLWQAFVQIVRRNPNEAIFPELIYIHITWSEYRRSYEDDQVLLLAKFLVTRWKETFKCLEMRWSKFVGIPTTQALIKILGEERLRCL